MPTHPADLDSLIAPIADDDASGPDLEADDDDDYLNFTSSAEIVLPSEYMVTDHEGAPLPFYNHPDFKDLDLARLIASARRLCSRTHDIRLLALLAKLHLLNRSVEAFQTVAEAMAILLETAWDGVHPRVQDGEEAWRTGAVERLDEPLMVSALNNAALFTSRRYGALTWQTYAAAVRKASGDRDGTDTSGVDRVLAEELNAAPDAVRSVRDAIERLGRTLERIRAAFSARAVAGPPKLSRIGGAVARLQALFERLLPSGGPSSAPEGSTTEAAGDGAAQGEARQDGNARDAMATGRQAAAALEAATRYLSEAEPSSPALLLLRQAQALVGKPFLDAMRALFPEQVRHAGVTVASPTIFRLPLTQLAENGLPPAGDEAGDEAGDGTEAGEGEIPVPRSRADALSLLDAAASYYRTAEPSSPIPMLLDRARPLLGQDFMALVRSMLPARVLSDE